MAATGPSVGELAFSGAFGDSGGHAGSSGGLPAAQDGGLMPGGIGSKEMPTIGGAGIDSAVKLGGNLGEMFSAFKAGAQALGASISDVMGRISNYLGTQEAKGDQLDMQHISISEVANPVFGVQGDLQLKEATFKGHASAEH